jgi:hypothetical protein
MGLHVGLGLKPIRSARPCWTFNALLVYSASVNRSSESGINPLRLSYDARCAR